MLISLILALLYMQLREGIKLLHTLPPHIDFAFVSNFIDKKTLLRSMVQSKAPNIPTIEAIISVPDIKEWHSLNVAINKSHYTVAARMHHGAVASELQRFGGNVHYNKFIDEEGNLIRYGVIQTSKLEKDLTLWESLIVSSYMQKPYTVLKDCPQLYDAQLANLKSAIALSGLLTYNGSKDDTFFSNIATIPRYSYSSSKYFQLIDTSHFKKIAKENLPEFRRIYGPIIKEHFGDIISIDNGTFEVKS